MRRLILSLLLFALGSSLNSAAALNQDARVLAWVANGARPGSLANTSERGAIVTLDGAGEVVETWVQVSAGDTYVMPCTEQATSPDGEHFAFFVGNSANGTLYLMTGPNAPTALVNISPRACLGMGTFEWQADSSAFALIDFSTEVGATSIRYGTLSIRPSADPTAPRFERENVAAFDMDGDTLALLEVLNDSVRVYHGTTAELTETTRVFTDRENCPFSVGDVRIINERTLAVLLGQNCGSGNRWALYTVDIPSRTANRVLTGGTGRDDSGTPIYVEQAANAVLFAPRTGDSVYLSYPDGLLGNFSAFIERVDFRQVQDSTPHYDFMVMPRQPRSGTFSAEPILSRNGRYLALIRQTADVDSALMVFDLNARDVVREIDGGNLGDVVSAMAFTPDNRTLVYVTGGADGADNLLFKVNLADGETTELTRGNFLPPMVISPDSKEALILDLETTSADDPYTRLISVQLSDGALADVFNHTEIADDGDLISSEFAAPLSWRP